MTAILTLTVATGCDSTVEPEFVPVTEVEVSEAECLEIVTDWCDFCHDARCLFSSVHPLICSSSRCLEDLGVCTPDWPESCRGYIEEGRCE